MQFRLDPLASVAFAIVWAFIIMEAALIIAAIILLALGHWWWALAPGLPALAIAGLFLWIKGGS